MGTAYISTTVTAEINGVTLLETDCVAEVEYVVDAGELADWFIRDFKFEETKPVWDDTAKVWTRSKPIVAWCPDVLRPTLMHYADKDQIEEALVEQLLDSGEMYFQAEGQRRDYHARVL